MEYLDKVNFETLALDMVGAFYEFAAGDQRLREPLKIDLLRRMVADMSDMVDLLKRQAEANEESRDVLKQISRAADQMADGQDRGNELLESIKKALDDASEGIYSQRAAYRTIMDALGRSGLEEDKEMAAELKSIHTLLKSIRDSLRSPEQSLTTEALEEMETTYRQSIVDQFRALTFRGITPSGKAISLPLEKLYVELKAVADVPDVADAYSAEERRLLMRAGERGGPDHEEMVHHLDILRLERWKKEARSQTTRLERRSITDTIKDRHRRGVVILGDPGSGKTTLLHHLALTLAREPDAKNTLPIFLPLAAYDDYLNRETPDAPLSEFLAYYYENWRNLPGLAPLFQQALERGRAVLLLDGLDEVLETSARQYVAGQTEALVRQWTARGNQCVVTSRVVGYREAPLPDKFTHVTVLDFGRPEIETFAHQWCLAYETWVQGGETPTALQQAKYEEGEFLKDVESNSGVEHLAANPLLLTMLALLRRQLGKLPDRRIELYERYIRTLTDNWRDARSMGARRQAPARFDPHKAIAHLIALALWFQQNKPSGTARRNELERVLQKICLRYTGEDREISELSQKALVDARNEADNFLKDMRYFAGLLAERGRDAFGFLHLTFQEYFAGRALARIDKERRWKVIKSNLHNPRWQEPILLCVGQLGVVEQRHDQASELTRNILEAESEYENILHRDLFLAAAIASDDVSLAAPVLDEVFQRLDSLKKNIIPTVQAAAINGLSQLARLNHGDATDALCTSLEDASLRNAVLKGVKSVIGHKMCNGIREAVLNLLDNNDGGVRKAAVNALVSIVSVDAEVRSAVLTHLEDSSYNVRESAVNALTNLVSVDAEVRSAVLTHLEDSSYNVRESAVNALASLVNTDAEIRCAVLVLLKDEKSQIRAAAVNALASLMSADAETRTAVLARLEDSYNDVRAAAANFLARFVSADAEVKSAVLTRMQDNNEQVRAAAVNALASLVNTDAEIRCAVLALLKDEKSQVRAAAVNALASLVSADAEVRITVLNQLNDNHRHVRARVMRALRSLISTDSEVQNSGPT